MSAHVEVERALRAADELYTAWEGPKPAQFRNAMEAALRNGRPDDDGDEGPDVEVLNLADLLADPEALAPPKAVVFPLAHRGRVTLFSAREKIGKSTTARGAIAAKSRGRPYMGQTPEAGPCLLLALEEHRSDVVRSLAEFDAYGPDVFIVERLGADPFGALEAAVRGTGAELCVVDTLAAFAETLEAESGDAAAWTAVMQRFGRIARDTDVGLVLVHHGRKADGSYRDSTAIGAGADMLLALDDGDLDGVKKITPKGRWELRPLSFRIREATDEWPYPVFEVTSGDMSIDAKVLLYVEQNPGRSTRAIRDAVQGRSQEIGAAVHRLAGSAIEDRGSGRRSAWYAFEAGA